MIILGILNSNRETQFLEVRVRKCRSNRHEEVGGGGVMLLRRQWLHGSHVLPIPNVILDITQRRI